MILPNTVRTVGFAAFMGATNLASVTFEDGSAVESLGSYVSNLLRPSARTASSNLTNSNGIHPFRCVAVFTAASLPRLFFLFRRLRSARNSSL